jgi:hypothetical protein
MSQAQETPGEWRRGCLIFIICIVGLFALTMVVTYNQHVRYENQPLEVPVGAYMIQQEGPGEIRRAYAVDSASHRIYFYRGSW